MLMEGAKTLNIMTFSITINNVTLSIMKFNAYTNVIYAECHNQADYAVSTRLIDY
jgi:hypothetical protein